MGGEARSASLLRGTKLGNDKAGAGPALLVTRKAGDIGKHNVARLDSGTAQGIVSEPSADL